MKTKSGYETDGTYIKFKSGFTNKWCVELESMTYFFNSEKEADTFISSPEFKKITEISICKK